MEAFDLSIWAKSELWTLKKKLENLKYKVDIEQRPSAPPAPGPERFLQIDFASEALLAALYETVIASGDPDGSPAIALRQFKTELADIYVSEAKRLQAEVASLQGRRFAKELM